MVPYCSHRRWVLLRAHQGLARHFAGPDSMGHWKIYVHNWETHKREVTVFLFKHFLFFYFVRFISTECNRSEKIVHWASSSRRFILQITLFLSSFFLFSRPPKSNTMCSIYSPPPFLPWNSCQNQRSLSHLLVTPRANKNLNKLRLYRYSTVIQSLPAL